MKVAWFTKVEICMTGIQHLKHSKVLKQLISTSSSILLTLSIAGSLFGNGWILYAHTSTLSLMV